MKAIVCEMCSGNQMRKENGYFVCQSCGTQYSLEEAKKLYIEIAGTVKIDKSDEINNLYQAARMARESNSYSVAIADYDMLSRLCPNDWEPIFYSALLKAYNAINGDIQNTAVNIINCLPLVFNIVYNINDEAKRKVATKEVADQSYLAASYLINASHRYRDSITGGTGSAIINTLVSPIGSATSVKYYTEDTQRCITIAKIMIACGSIIESRFDMNDAYYLHLNYLCWKMVVKFNKECKANDTLNHNALFKLNYINSIANKLRAIEKEESRIKASEAASATVSAVENYSREKQQISEDNQIRIIEIDADKKEDYLKKFEEDPNLAASIRLFFEEACELDTFASVQSYWNTFGYQYIPKHEEFNDFLSEKVNHEKSFRSNNSIVRDAMMRWMSELCN